MTTRPTLLTIAVAFSLLAAPLSGCSWFEDDEPATGSAAATSDAGNAAASSSATSGDAIPSASSGGSGGGGSTQDIPSASGQLSGPVQPVPSASGGSSAVPIQDTGPQHRVRGPKLATGSFRGLDGRTVTGSVAVIDLGNGIAVSFASDFNAGDIDPENITVGLGRSGSYLSEGDLGPLKKTEGAQFYLVPIRIDVTAYGEIYLVNREALQPLAVAEITATF